MIVEIEGKKYELFHEKWISCKQCIAFRLTLCKKLPDNCFEVDTIWKEVKDADKE